MIDGGNSRYHDDIRRSKHYAEKGVYFVDCGTSGGVWGLDRGYCLMIGGADEAVDRLNPIWDSIAPGMGDIPHPGSLRSAVTRRAGMAALRSQWGRSLRQDGPQRHRVRDHGGVRRGPEHPAQRRRGRQQRDQDAETAPLENPDWYRYDIDTTEVSELWRRGSVVGSWLLDLTAAALYKSPTLDEFSGRVSDSGEGRWTSQAAIDVGVPTPVLTSALFSRFDSQGNALFANQVQSAMRKEFGGHDEDELITLLRLEPDWVLPVEPARSVLADHSIVIDGSQIAAVLPRQHAIAEYPDAPGTPSGPGGAARSREHPHSCGDDLTAGLRRRSPAARVVGAADLAD